MTVSSTPGKVYLFGEHVVVYGEPAVSCAVEHRTTVTVSARNDDRVRVRTKDLSLNGFTVEYHSSTRGWSNVNVPTPLTEVMMGYVNAAVDQARDTADVPDAGFDITAESDIPLRASLGSSVAVVVAGVDAAAHELGLGLEPCEPVGCAYQVEHEVQDGQVSRAGTFCSAMGGAVCVEGDDCRTIDVSPLPFVIGFDDGADDTGALVSGVRTLREKYDFAADIVSTASDIVRRGEELLAEADPDADDSPEELLSKLGRFVDFSHDFLGTLGVSPRSFDSTVWAAREAGAYGAGPTGADGGGCIVSLNPAPGMQTTSRFTPGCEDALHAEPATKGIRVEVLPDTDTDAEGEAERECDGRNGAETGTDSS